MKNIYFIALLALCVLTGCNDDLSVVSLTAEQRELIGTAVNFEPYVANFNITRAEPAKPMGNSNNHEGGFNANDMMYIYRQYWVVDEETKVGHWEYKNPPGTIYKYTDLNLGESGVFDKTSWRVYEGKTFKFYDQEYTNPESNYDTSLPAEQQSHSYLKKLTKGDSIIWESGSTVRFRAWALSRMGNTLADGSVPGAPQTINYPDYMVCDWVTVSGPTMGIPLAMRHLGCRLGFVPRDNNQFVKIEIATDPEDYMHEDNAQSDADDKTDKHPEFPDPEHPETLTAAQCAANVKDAYDRMCWPAGVDMENMALQTCSPDEQTKYGHGTINTNFIKERNADGTYKNVKHAQFFSSSDSRYYMVSIPYDMTTMEPIVLPPYTRFKVWLRDVNKGDGGTNEQTGLSENRYHIFRLSDVKKSGTSEPAFPDGFTMLSGYSATFSVGYHYGHTLEIWAEDSFSWDEVPLGTTTSEDQHLETDKPAATTYYWWTSAITAACGKARQGQTYKPEFKISNQNELLEFAKLVNGDFTTTPIYKKVTIKKDPGGRVENHEVEWYTGIGTNGDGTPDTLWISREALQLSGYVLYDKYTPSIADRPATIEEDYLKAPYNFYDDQVKSRWTVTLSQNIDLKDWKLPAIGNEATDTKEETPFCGYFDGAGHKLSNIYMDGGLLFGYAKNGTIANLLMESTHPLSITGTCENERVIGCSVIAPSTTATLANKTLGYCYFVGCFHQGKSSAPLVNDSQGLGFEMYGCMQANDGIASGSAALANITTSEPIVAIISDKTELEEIKWGKVSCNYYDTELSPGSVAFHTPSGSMSAFHRLQYIRGSKTHILCAKNDFLVDSKTEWNKLVKERKDELYGVAPWRAMNYGIYVYNSTVREDIDRCKMHYEPATNVGYSHLYPVLTTGLLTASEEDKKKYLNVLEQFN